jgi:ABC-type uncharacterized transport system ATPase subunit
LNLQPAKAKAGPIHQFSTNCGRVNQYGKQAIEVQSLSKRFCDLQAVRGVSLEVQAGGILSLLGPNGAGCCPTCLRPP